MNRLIRPVVWSAAVAIAWSVWQVESFVLEHLVLRRNR